MTTVPTRLNRTVASPIGALASFLAGLLAAGAVKLVPGLSPYASDLAALIGGGLTLAGAELGRAGWLAGARKWEQHILSSQSQQQLLDTLAAVGALSHLPPEVQALLSVVGAPESQGAGGDPTGPAPADTPTDTSTDPAPVDAPPVEQSPAPDPAPDPPPGTFPGGPPPPPEQPVPAAPAG